MGDRLIDLEERLEKLVPRELSDDALVRLEDEIDLLVESVDETPSPRTGRVIAWGATAACLVASLVLLLNRPVSEGPSAALPVEDLETLPVVEYLGSQVYVTEMTDDGWDLEEGSEHPVRYWISMVTETEELLDNESGYQVRVVSEREMVEPIALTHL